MQQQSSKFPVVLLVWAAVVSFAVSAIAQWLSSAP
jgi:hypothetical protein